MLFFFVVRGKCIIQTRGEKKVTQKLSPQRRQFVGYSLLSQRRPPRAPFEAAI